MAITLVYCAALLIEGGGFFPPGLVPAVGAVTAIYTVVIGVPAFLMFKGLRLHGALAYVLTGLVASTPMLAFCLYQGDPLYLVTTLLAGALYGGAFAFYCRAEPNKSLEPTR